MKGKNQLQKTKTKELIPITNTQPTPNISRDLYDSKFCARCWVNGLIKKWRIVFKYSYSARCCGKCIDELGGVGETAEWLSKNASFDSKGNLYFPKNTGVN